MEKWTYRNLKGQNLQGTLPPELNRLRYLQVMYVNPNLSLTSKFTILLNLFYIFSHLYLYSTIFHDKVLLSLYYSDLARNYLKGPIPKEWGSLTNIYKLYELSLTSLIWFFNIDCFILYVSILTYGPYFTFFIGLSIQFLVCNNKLMTTCFLIIIVLSSEIN